MEVRAGGTSRLGYSYAGYGSAYVTEGLLADIVIGHEAFDVEDWRCAMVHAVRISPGVASMAVAVQAA